MFPKTDIERKRLRDEAYRLKLLHRGPEVYFRGLIEISNICRKNCLYCGIRSGNACAQRYEMTDDQVLQEAQFALDAGYGSIAIQGGERSDSAFIERITRLIYDIRRLVPGGGGKPAGGAGSCRAGEGYGAAVSAGGAAAAGLHAAGTPTNDLGITLSLGEQPIEVYREWKKAGASRYLLRIEASNRELYGKIHPGPGAFCSPAAAHAAAVSPAAAAHSAATAHSAAAAADISAVAGAMHSYDTRVRALQDLKSAGYLLGTGVMIGLPFQTYSHLEEDLRFFREMEVDMVGMGPYIPHKDTPLGRFMESVRSNAAGDSADGIPSGDELCGGSAGCSADEIPSGDVLCGGTPGKGLSGGDFMNLSNGELLELCIDMVARLRILMPHINIAATTALQVLDPDGREKALLAGANVIMPNMTETALRGSYSLYEGKQGVEDDAASTRTKLLDNLARLGIPVGWNLRGDWK